MTMPTCFYVGRTPMANGICNECPSFLNICIPVADDFGFALGAECDLYFCERVRYGLRF